MIHSGEAMRAKLAYTTDEPLGVRIPGTRGRTSNWRCLCALSLVSILISLVCLMRTNVS
jgi:hypothetical protein